MKSVFKLWILYIVLNDNKLLFLKLYEQTIFSILHRKKYFHICKRSWETFNYHFILDYIIWNNTLRWRLYVISVRSRDGRHFHALPRRWFRDPGLHLFIVLWAEVVWSEIRFNVKLFFTANEATSYMMMVHVGQPSVFISPKCTCNVMVFNVLKQFYLRFLWSF